MHSKKMTRLETRAIFSLSAIMALRMIGLFMVLPLFALYAHHLANATPFLIGMAMGMYGLAQALCQIPFGVLSDRYGRKPIILLGLLIFALGSFIAGSTDSIIWIIIGRTLQGAGAIGSTILALIADLTSEEQRTKAMAISGITIGLSFSIAMFLGPVLTTWISVSDLFYLAAIFGLIGILFLYFLVPTPIKESWHRDTEPEFVAFINLLRDQALLKLNIGIFILHAIFTASFIAIPISLYYHAGLESHRQWLIYLPALFAAFIFVIIAIGLSERKQQIKPYFLMSIFAIALAELILWLYPTHFTLTTTALFLFFWGFSLLESFLPSLISRTAPATRKGSALGIYSCAQYFGIFIGGVLGGWLYGKFSYSGIYLLCIALAIFWLFLAFFMQPPRYVITRMWRIGLPNISDWQAIAKKLRSIPGMLEVNLMTEEGIAYLKMERSTLKHPDFIRLQEQLQSE